jgi:hypothetical protein
MKFNFKETIHLKTELELQRISKDIAFYSSEERLLALEELEKRFGMPEDMVNVKKNLIISTESYPILEGVPTQRIYKTSMMWVGSYLGGPLVAGYIIAENFKAFGEPKLARKAWIYSIVATIVIFAILFSIPEKTLDAIPSLVIPFLYTIAAYFLMQHFHDRNIGIHLSSGGRTFSWGRVIIVGLIGLIVTFALIVSITLIIVE